MAKDKSKPVEPEVVEEKAEETVKEAKTDNSDAFIARTLRAINKMENPAKAERLANRLLRKRER